MNKIYCLVIFLTIFLSNQVFACLCNGNWSVREGFKASDIILVGKIISYQYTKTISSFLEDKINKDSIKWSPELFSNPLAKI